MSSQKTDKVSLLCFKSENNELALEQMTKKNLLEIKKKKNANRQPEQKSS